MFSPDSRTPVVKKIGPMWNLVEYPCYTVSKLSKYRHKYSNHRSAAAQSCPCVSFPNPNPTDQFPNTNQHRIKGNLGLPNTGTTEGLALSSFQYRILICCNAVIPRGYFLVVLWFEV